MLLEGGVEAKLNMANHAPIQIKAAATDARA
jgi:hypothetical protein